MAAAQKFHFGADFRSGARPAVDEQALAAAREEGVRAGRAQAQAEADASLGQTAARIAQGLDQLLAAEGRRAAALEQEAARLALALARALAGAALSDRPHRALEDALRDCFEHARQAPHLAVRVHDAAVEAIETVVRRRAQEAGFAGRVIVLGDPEISPGDARIEWADGGVAIEPGRIAALIDETVAKVFGPAATNSFHDDGTP